MPETLPYCVSLFVVVFVVSVSAAGDDTRGVRAFDKKEIYSPPVYQQSIQA